MFCRLLFVVRLLLCVSRVVCSLWSVCCLVLACFLFSVRCLSFLDDCLLLAVCCLRFVFFFAVLWVSLLVFVGYWLFWFLLNVGCCLLFVIRGSLLVVCRCLLWLFVVCVFCLMVDV